MFRNALFCHKAGTRTVAKYNLKRMEVSAEVQLPSAGVANTFPYQFGLNSDIDLAVDELGVYFAVNPTMHQNNALSIKFHHNKNNHKHILAIKTLTLCDVDRGKQNVSNFAKREFYRCFTESN